MKDYLLLIGPCPPPDGGTTLPFYLFYEYVKERFGSQYKIVIINSNTGDKSSVSLFSPSTIIHILKLYLKISWYSLFSSKIVAFGSQRFITLTGGLLVLVYKPFGKRIFLRVNGGAYDIFFKNAGALTRIIAKSVLPRADRIVVQTELVKGEMMGVWGSKVVSAPNYRQVFPSSSGSRKFNGNRVFFIYTGIVREQKGIRHLIDAYVLMKDSLIKTGRDSIEIGLEIYGSIHPDMAEFIDAGFLQKHQDIVFYGPVSNSDLQDKYLSADVFVFPTFWPTEGHSGSVVEAMMSGLPILCTAWRAMPEVVEDGVSGLLFEAGQTARLAELMFLMCTDAELRRRLSVGALEASQKFNMDMVLPKMAELFEL